MKQEAIMLAELLEKISDIHTRAGIKPEDMSTLYAYACQSADRGDLKSADQLLYALLLLDASNFDYSLALGLCRQKQGLQKEALFYFLRANGIKNTDPRPFYHAASSHQKLGDVDSARRALLATIQCNLGVDGSPADAESQSYRAQCQALQQKAQQLLAQLPSAQ